MKFAVFVSCSVIVHVVLFASIFDIYFTSPLVRDVTSISIDKQVKPQASRLVLFVADGLRADKFFENENRTLFMRDKMLHKGTWGVSHTHIPTESRPGHVALIAGFYEDVSAVMRGWKENPVEFDSIFNQSKETWSWGSPDILPMFAKGATGSHVHINCYHSDVESFAGDDSSLLDTWVFDKIQQFFDEATKNSSLRHQLHQDKIVFFLHLLGLDSNGHSHKPMSSEYLSNIKTVDEGIKKTVEILEEFYDHDHKTAFVFTADHGMTDWGSHGAGLPSETLTPLVAWGAGIRSSNADPVDYKGFNPELSDVDKKLTSLWGLDPNQRYDVEQADVAALMAALLGIPFPVNSVGSLPVDYLSGSLEQKARLAFANARQIAEQFTVKMEEVKEHAIRVFFHPFSGLSVSGVKQRNLEMNDLITKGEYEKVIHQSKELLNLSLLGLRYYHTYDRTFLYLSVLSSFIGWIFLTVLLGSKQIHVIVSQARKLQPIKESKIIGFNYVKVFSVVLSMLVIVLLLAMRSPWTYYVYCLLPVPIWYSIVADRYVIRAIWFMLARNQDLTRRILLYILIGTIGIWIMIGSFFYRNLLSVGLLLLMFLPQFTAQRDESSTVDKVWMSACLLLSIFPLLPVVGRNPDMRLVLFGGLMATLLSILISYQAKNRDFEKFSMKLERHIKFLFPISSACIVFMTSNQSTDSGSVSIMIHLASWSIFVLSLSAPLMSSTKLKERLVSLYTWQMSLYILLSLSYDAVFCVVLCGLMHVWIHLEHNLMESEEKQKQTSNYLQELDFQHSHIKLDDTSALRQPNLSDVRRSFMLVFFLVVAFFGVGNIASINSFDVRVVLPFVTVFDPFIMGAILAFKVLLPYLMVTCSFCGVALATRMQLRTLCCIVMVISDVMAMHFVFMVQDHGSWLDIGTSISHFVIVMAMITSLLLFFVIANFLTKFSQKWV